MNTQTLLDNVATINKDNGIFVNAKEFLQELRQVATAVAKSLTIALTLHLFMFGLQKIT